MVWGSYWRGGQPQTTNEEVVAKALGVNKRKGEKSHPANIGSNITAGFCI